VAEVIHTHSHVDDFGWVKGVTPDHPKVSWSTRSGRTWIAPTVTITRTGQELSVVTKAHQSVKDGDLRWAA
jgi:alkyl sulfatase BDS1-like metallo-beta-lactamase superfamily hydrolase